MARRRVLLGVFLKANPNRMIWILSSGLVCFKKLSKVLRDRNKVPPPPLTEVTVRYCPLACLRNVLIVVVLFPSPEFQQLVYDLVKHVVTGELEVEDALSFFSEITSSLVR